MVGRKNKSGLSGLIISGVAFLVILGILLMGIYNSESKFTAQRLTAAKEAVVRATVSCYAIEGIYPPDLDYLKEHYGLAVDEESYVVYYDAYASNLMPDIEVIPKG